MRLVSVWRPARGFVSPKRTIFSLPNLSPFSNVNGGSLEPQHYFEQKILPYSREQLYGIVSDVRSYPKFIPFCLDAKIFGAPKQATRTGSGFSDGPMVQMDAELTVGFLSLNESYTSKVTCTPYRTVEAVASSSTPLFKELTTIWKFEPAPVSSSTEPSSPTSQAQPVSDRTLVTLNLRYAFASPIHAAVSAGFFGQVSKLMVKAFEDRCQQVYGCR